MISKTEANAIVVSPFTNEAVSLGVDVFTQAILPLEATAALNNGELELAVMMPQAAKQAGSDVEILAMRVVPYTARKSVEDIMPYTSSQDLKKIVSRQPLKQVNNSNYPYSAYSHLFYY